MKRVQMLSMTAMVLFAAAVGVIITAPMSQQALAEEEKECVPCETSFPNTPSGGDTSCSGVSPCEGEQGECSGEQYESIINGYCDDGEGTCTSGAATCTFDVKKGTWGCVAREGTDCDCQWDENEGTGAGSTPESGSDCA